MLNRIVILTIISIVIFSLCGCDTRSQWVVARDDMNFALKEAKTEAAINYALRGRSWPPRPENNNTTTTNVVSTGDGAFLGGSGGDVNISELDDKRLIEYALALAVHDLKKPYPELSPRYGDVDGLYEKKDLEGLKKEFDKATKRYQQITEWFKNNRK